METVNKHPDSANDSVDSFEDAIDNLDLQEDTSNPEDHSKHSYLKKDEVSLNNNVALSNEKCDSTETIAEKNTKNLGILNTIVKDINTANRPMNTEQMSIKTSILPTESDKKDITDKIAIITDDLADFSMNKTKSESAYAVTSDSKIIQDEKITGKDNNIITVEKTALKEDPKIIDKDIVKDSDKEALSCDKNHDFANKSEILIEDPSNELDKEEISYKNDTTSVELLHNHINEKAIPSESEIGSNNETTELDGQEATANQNVELSSEIGTKNEKVEPCSKVDTYNENIEPDNKSPIRKENVEFNSKVDTCKEYLEADNYLETNNEKNPPESKLEKSEDSVDNTDEEGSIKSEREQGDGQGEQDEGKKELELDEDKRNPEYIPKKGSFYEHDTRTLDGFDDDVKKFEEEIAVKNKKKSKSIAAEGRWQHDKYDEIEQCPKSQQEIIDSYGYDIRNEEHPPKARRNRRYGRGPNKYNRNWEDEKAYIKIEYKGPRNSEGRQNKSINDRTRQNKPSTREENYSDFREKQNTSTSNPDIIDNSDKYPPLLHYSDKIGMKAEKGGWAPPPPFSQKNVVHKSKLGGDDDSAKPQGRYDPSNMDQDQPDEREALAVLPSLPPKDLPTIVADKSGPPKQKAFSSLPLNNMPAFVPAPAYRPSLPAKGPSVNIPPNWYLSQNKIERTGPPDSPELSHKDYSKLPGGIAALRGGKRYSVQRQQSLESRSASATAEIDAMTTDETGPPSQALPPTAFYHHPATGPDPPLQINYSENWSGSGHGEAIFDSCSPEMSDFVTDFDEQEKGAELEEVVPALTMEVDDLQDWVQKLPSHFYAVSENGAFEWEEEGELLLPASISMEDIKEKLCQGISRSNFLPSTFSALDKSRLDPPPPEAMVPWSQLFPGLKCNLTDTRDHTICPSGNDHSVTYSNHSVTYSNNSVTELELLEALPPIEPDTRDHTTSPSGNDYPVTDVTELELLEALPPIETDTRVQTISSSGNDYPVTDVTEVELLEALPIEADTRGHTTSPSGDDHLATDTNQLELPEALSKIALSNRAFVEAVLTSNRTSNLDIKTSSEMLTFLKSQSHVLDESLIALKNFNKYFSSLGNVSPREDTLVDMQAVSYANCYEDTMVDVQAVSYANCYEDTLVDVQAMSYANCYEDTLVDVQAVSYADCYESFPTNYQTPPISLPQSSPSHLVFRQSPPPPVKVISADASCYHSHMYSAENPHPISNGAGGAPPMLLPVHFVSPPPAQVPSFNNAQAPIMSYGPQPLQFQPMQPIVSLPPPPQTEVFQPAGGITYYSPQTQAVLQRPALSKRVKSAIPIVPPSEVNNIQQTNLVQQPPNNVVQLSNPIQLSDAVINNAIQQKIQLVPVDNSKKDDNLNN